MQGQSIIKHVSEIRIIEIPLDSLDRFLSFNSYKLILDFPVKVQTSIQMTIDSQKHV